MKKQATLEFYKGFCEFSAGHFTIFSKDKREYLHGHNYSVAALVTAAIQEPGMVFDYQVFKVKLKTICDRINRRFLLPENSPYLKIHEEGDYYYAMFNGEKIPFLKKDVVLLPVSNTTLEELSQWFLQQITNDEKFIRDHQIFAIEIKVYNGNEQSANCKWEQQFPVGAAS